MEGRDGRLISVIAMMPRPLATAVAILWLLIAWLLATLAVRVILA